MVMAKELKICLAASAGGHISQLLKTIGKLEGLRDLLRYNNEGCLRTISEIW
jgi:hypothetical protein